MRYVDVGQARFVSRAARADAPVIYIIESADYPFELGEDSFALSSSLVAMPVRHWNDALTPWSAEGLYRGEEPFGGHASVTLDEIINEVIPGVEKSYGLRPRLRAICGYSLGGLFALYALVNSESIDACACLSGSMWYEGWTDYLRDLDVNLLGKFAFLSIGTKEKRAAPPILKTSQYRMEECARILEQKGCLVRYQKGPGSHMQYVRERFAAGLAALDSFC